MSVSPETTSGTIREVIELRRFPWIRPLVDVYANRFDTVASLFAGNPKNPDDWRQTIARVQRANLHPDAIARVVEQQLERRQAPREARDAAARLHHRDTVAIVTGQQAGVFGGPLYTLLKAVTSIQLARRVESEFGVPAVPVFWVDEEDHDWDEIRVAHVLDGDMSVREIRFADVPGAGSHMISQLAFDDGAEQTMTALGQALAPTEFTGELLAQLSAHYRAGVGVSAAFAGWIEALLGRSGLVVFESADRAAKPLVADLFAAELAQPGRTSRLAREAGDEMRRLGHEPQVEPGEDSAALFFVDDAGRHAIKIRRGEYVVGDRTASIQSLADEAKAHPDRFSPNVLLRPIVQDQLFPTVCYVSGPSELAYQAQLKPAYVALGVEPPLLYPRASATLLDAGAGRFLDRHHVALEAFQDQNDTVLNKLLEQQLPATLEPTFEETNRDIARRAEALKQDVAKVDPTLTGAVDTTVDRIHDSLKTLHHKIIQAAKRKDDTMRRQFQRTRNLTFPLGHQQERVLNVIFAVNRYGFSIGDRLIESLPLDTGKHYVLTL